MKRFIVIALSLLWVVTTYAQSRAHFIGLRLGGAYSLLKGLDKVLVSEDYYSNYTLKESGTFAPSLEVYYLYHSLPSSWAVSVGLAYYQRTGCLKYTDINALNYELKSAYHHIGFIAEGRFYPMNKGLYVAAGIRVGANLSPRGLKYRSNQEEPQFAHLRYGSIAETERLLQEKLTGQPDVSAGGGLGYDFPFGLTLGLRYYYGFTSSVKTETNAYRWIENPNHHQSLTLTIGYQLPL